MSKRKTPTKKNISFESLDSVDLKKEVDLKAGTDAVQTKAAHIEEQPKPKAKAPVKAKAAPPKEKKEELIRVTVDIPKSEHKRLKIAAMEADLKLYQYVLRIIRAEIGTK
jgi:predicted HicB family RNase H-like nuclease